MKEFIINNWYAIPSILFIGGLLLKFIKSEKFQNFAKCGIGHGELIDTVIPAKVGKQTYDKFLEGMLVTFCDFISSYFQNVKTGILKNNVKKMARAKMEDTEEFKLMNDEFQKAIGK